VKLYWNERGAICCGKHAPRRKTDTWVWDRWTAMTAADVEAWKKEVGSEPTCEVARSRGTENCGERKDSL
jgi:hypothetical protein